MGIGKQIVSTRSRPKAAERQKQAVVAMRNVSTRSRPKAAEHLACAVGNHVMFQHAAARRRLTLQGRAPNDRLAVSTRSRPKAADRAENSFSS